MPAKSKKQQKFMGIVKSMKRGKTPRSYSKKAAKAASSMSMAQVDDFAGTRRKGLPTRKTKQSVRKTMYRSRSK